MKSIYVTIDVRDGDAEQGTTLDDPSAINIRIPFSDEIDVSVTDFLSLIEDSLAVMVQTDHKAPIRTDVRLSDLWPTKVATRP